MNLRPLGYEPNELPTAPSRDDNGIATVEWGEEDSNLRRHCQQIYSLSPLATRESPRYNSTVYHMSHPLSRAFYANVQSRFPVASGTDPEMPRKLIGEIIIIVKADLLCNDRDGIPGRQQQHGSRFQPVLSYAPNRRDRKLPFKKHTKILAGNANGPGNFRNRQFCLIM